MDIMGWGHSKSTFAQRGGGGLTKSEQKRTWGGGGAFTIAYVRFSKFVLPILFTLAIVIELFS